LPKPCNGVFACCTADGTCCRKTGGHLHPPRKTLQEETEATTNAATVSRMNLYFILLIFIRCHSIGRSFSAVTVMQQQVGKYAHSRAHRIGKKVPRLRRSVSEDLPLQVLGKQGK